MLLTMLRTNTVFCCQLNEIIARLKEYFKYETQLPLTGPILNYNMLETFIFRCVLNEFYAFCTEMNILLQSINQVFCCLAIQLFDWQIWNGQLFLFLTAKC